ncbi:diaminopimelate epimerase [Psychromicrobium xiongbiense]|uniref:diaminopimelate epimerase n=1 Tax=Psychromicrobium xiongbiense TaxID=3051184 RepID=UPI002555E7F1|nr:diaminopimelate epimerase [Psychromicrobium sp. YIM S02556]
MVQNGMESLSGVAFRKGHGTGNDFVLLRDAEGALALDASTVAVVCDRRRGVGGDGLIRAIKSAQLPDGRAVLDRDPSAEWFMDYRNADGSISQMCGNGVRVFVEFLLDEGLASLEDGGTLAIGTRAGVKYVQRVPNGYAVDMGPWSLAEPEQAATAGVDALVKAHELDVARPALSINTGNEHTVVALAHRAELDELELFRAPVVDPAPVNGSNVEFALPHEPLVVDGVAEISMRVYERGVGETLSCGTGACAAAAATRYWAGPEAPDSWRVQVPGGTLGVRFFTAEDGLEHVELSGPAVLVASGVLG